MISQLSLFKSRNPYLEKYVTDGVFIDFERKDYCRNYFILSTVPIFCEECDFLQNASQSVGVENSCGKHCTLRLKSGCYRVLGYFSLACSVVDVSGSLASQKKLSRIVRLSSKKINYVESYLIGHLSKNYFDDYHLELNGDEIFNHILSLIREANAIVGTNVVRVDCINDKKIIHFYESNGFQQLPLLSVTDTNDSKELLTFIRQVR